MEIELLTHHNNQENTGKGKLREEVRINCIRNEKKL